MLWKVIRRFERWWHDRDTLRISDARRRELHYDRDGRDDVWDWIWR